MKRLIKSGTKVKPVQATDKRKLSSIILYERRKTHRDGYSLAINTAYRVIINAVQATRIFNAVETVAGGFFLYGDGYVVFAHT